jgi:hypothetical protein
MAKLRKRLKNEWANKKPTPAEIKAAQNLAKKVSKRLLEMLEAAPVE